MEAFLSALPAAPERLLMLDYDGTLAPFHIDPSRATPYPGVVAALNAIARVPRTRLVIVSGRTAKELPPLLALERQPEIWGAHGWERLLPDGRLEVRELSVAARRALEEAEKLGAEVLTQGARLERKSAGIAVHWRGLEGDVAERIAEWASHAWEPLSTEASLALLPFDGGLELRASDCSKALAVEAAVAAAHPQAAIAYLGDDITDEDAFRALKHRGLCVLVREQPRATSLADVCIRPPRELLAFLERWQVMP